MPLAGIGTLPTPFSPASVPLPPETGGRWHTSLRVGGWGGVPIPTRGIHYGTLYMYVLCGMYDHYEYSVYTQYTLNDFYLMLGKNFSFFLPFQINSSMVW